MRRHLLLVIVSLLTAVFGPLLASAQETPPAASAAETEGQALVARISEKLRQGPANAAALADEIAEFDVLVEKYRGSDAPGAAKILFAKAVLHLQVFDDLEEGRSIMEQVQNEFPDSPAAEVVPQVLAQLHEQEQTQRAKAAVVGQPAPELTFDWGSREGLTSLSDLRGKVVVLDFWATWCGPCVASFPQIRELADHYRDFPVEIVGVTSLQGRVHGLGAQPIDCRGQPEKERELMPQYMEAHQINWTIGFSEQPVFNPAFGISGIPHLAIVAPDGTVRHNGLHPGALSLAQKTALIDALLVEAGLPTPTR